MTDQTAQSNYVDSYSSNIANKQSPTEESTPSVTSVADDKEKLEEQNIFVLLGVKDSSDEDKEKFLDELQQVIWDDFLNNDVELLVTTDEMKQVEEIKAKSTGGVEVQEELVSYLEKLIPDLEELMLEKALELKEKMFKQRIQGIRDYFSGQEEKLAKLTEAENFVNQDKWGSALQILDGI
jgi:hypothetical protein